jgi:hypothetical protein
MWTISAMIDPAAIGPRDLRLINRPITNPPITDPPITNPSNP